jgi:hypothetical protein
MKNINEMTQPEFAAYIDDYLQNNGIEVVLSGGTAVEIYSKGIYVSKDIDFIENGLIRRSKLVNLLKGIGFSYRTRFFFHSESQFIVEFPKGPPSLGKEPISKINKLTFSTGTLRIISPTDCVKDRLANYFYFNDYQSLEQAILVAHSTEIDINEIERWCINEGKLKEYLDIKHQF